jgi:hypothetical protein
MKSSENLSAHHTEGRSQDFTFPRRELFQKVATAILPFLVLRKPLVPPLEVRPLPGFNIGDLVASDWVNDEDEDVTDFGEVIGFCYIPRHENFLRDRKGLLGNSWAYYIYWTRSTHGCESSFPCFDGEPIAPDELRLVSHA